MYNLIITNNNHTIQKLQIHILLRSVIHSLYQSKSLNTIVCVHMCVSSKVFTVFHVLASSVLVLVEAGLGSPSPTVLRATTLNSYSTQAFSPTTVAVSMLPLTASGTEKWILFYFFRKSGCLTTELIFDE